MKRYFGALAIAAAAAALPPAWSLLSAEQGQRAGAPPTRADTRVVPRMPDGKPDLTGVWDKPYRRNLAEGLEPLPFTAVGRSKFNDRVNVVDPTVHCALPGVPRVMTHPSPMEIGQRSGRVVILYEWMHNFRLIPTDGTPYLRKDAASTLFGNPNGRWEGDTLVVDSTDFMAEGETWLDDFGNQHGDALHVVERFTRIAYDRLQYEVTIEDPEFYTKPWGAKWIIPLAAPGTELQEDTCRTTTYGPAKDPNIKAEPGPRPR